MPDDSVRLEITLPSASGQKLARIASRAGVSEEKIAGALLLGAIDGAEVDARLVRCVLDDIPGAWDRIEAGIADARADRTSPFDAF
jgi:hypothetical protein